MRDKFSLLQVNHMLRIRSISHCMDISYVFLYLIFTSYIYGWDSKRNAVYHIYTVVIVLYLYLSEISSRNYNVNQKSREKAQSCRRNFQFRLVKYILLNVNVNYDSNTPSIETYLAVVRGPRTKKFLPECVNEKSSTERRS